MLKRMFGREKVVIGMVHLLPLPGSPRWGGDLSRVLEAARRDAMALEKGGVDGIIVENFGDAPFPKGPIEPHTLAAMTIVAKAVKDTVSIPVGINVLRNDSRSAMAIAYAIGGSFIRVNVHTGVMITDQGIIEGDAYRTLRYRGLLGTDVKIFADVLVKHAFPFGEKAIGELAIDTAERGLADALIVTGSRTGEPVDIRRLVEVKEAVPRLPVFVGSGVDESNVTELLSVADGVIVGTSLKEGGVITNPVDEARVRKLLALVAL
jgi:hypothetical protein